MFYRLYSYCFYVWLAHVIYMLEVVRGITSK